MESETALDSLRLARFLRRTGSHFAGKRSSKPISSRPPSSASRVRPPRRDMLCLSPPMNPWVHRGGFRSAGSPAACVQEFRTPVTSRASIAGTRRHADERGRLRVHVLRFCRARGDEIDASRWRRPAENPEQRTRRRDYCPATRRRGSPATACRCESTICCWSTAHVQAGPTASTLKAVEDAYKPCFPGLLSNTVLDNIGQLDAPASLPPRTP